MTARLVLSCDGHRHGQSCRGFWSGALVELGGALAAVLVAREQGWTTDGRHHRCPSPGHDEDATSCPTCRHPVVGHSSEPDVGCLAQLPPNPPHDLYPMCPCAEPGTSRADQ